MQEKPAEKRNLYLRNEHVEPAYNPQRQSR